MKKEKYKFEENINEVISNGESDFSFIIQMNDKTFKQKTLPSFLKNSFMQRFGYDVPNEIEFSIWFKEVQKQFNDYDKPIILY